MILVLKITQSTNSGTIVTAQTALSYNYFFSEENEKRMHMLTSFPGSFLYARTRLRIEKRAWERG